MAVERGFSAVGLSFKSRNITTIHADFRRSVEQSQWRLTGYEWRPVFHPACRRSF
ncbi:MAG: hypothetical protein ACR2NF_03255 [Pirellulales bacterium]